MTKKIAPDELSSLGVSCDTIGAAFRRAESVSPGKPFLITGSRVLTYGKLLDDAGRLCSLFREAGMLPGDRIIIASQDDETALIMFLASLHCGITAIMLDPKAPSPSARDLINNSSAKGIVLDESLHKSWLPPHHHFELRISRENPSNNLLNKLLGKKRSADDNGEDSYPVVLKKLEPSIPAWEPSPDMDAYIMFTSGTTSRPKGVQISRSSLCRHLSTLSGHFGYDSSSKILNILPLHHADGLIQGPMSAFWNCGCLIRPMSFSIANIPALLDKIYAERITHFVAVPTILSMINKFGAGYEDSFTTDDFKFIISAAAMLEENLWNSFEQKFSTRIVNVYGLTETVTGGLFSGPDDASRRVGTIGKPIDCEARIVDTDGSEVRDGVIGELIMSGGNIMKGYLDDPEGTNAVLKHRWLYTGDLAVKNNDGFFRITGRRKNLIINGGINISPEEVTEVLHSHDRVLEAVTFGQTDDIWGELVVSCVVVNGGGIDEAQLIEFCRSQLPPEKVPCRIHLLPQLPKGPSGKVILAEVRQLVGKSSQISDSTETFDIESRILSLASRCFKVPVNILSSGSRQKNTPGWDSLAHLEFVAAIERSFGIKLEPLDIIRLESLLDAVAIVNGKRHFQ